MTNRDRGLALLVAVMWGLNFIAVRVGLSTFPPVFLAALRYLLLAIPVVLFVPRPKVRFRWLVAYGLGFGTVQFGLLFVAISKGMPIGLSSLVLQISAPLTLLLAIPLLKERVSPRQLTGVAVAVFGLAVVALERAKITALLPLVLTVLAALGWAIGNLASRKAKPAEPLRFVLWMSIIPPLPLLAVSASVEGPTAGWAALREAVVGLNLTALSAILYVVIVGTVLGSGLWIMLLSRYSAGVVAPFSMLVPVVAMTAAWIVFDERPGLVSMLGATAIMLGVVIGLKASGVAPLTAPEPSAPPEPLLEPAVPRQVV